MRQIAFEVRKSRHIYYNKPPTQKSKALYIIILAIFRWQPNYWFNGIPFSIREKRILDCQYGLKYYKGREFTGERLCLQGTMKQGCSAHIHTYIPYPVSSYTKPRSKMKEWKVKKEVLQELRKAIEDGDGNGISTNSASFSHSENSYSCFGGYGWSFRSAVPPQTLCSPLFMWVILPDSLDRAYYPDLQDVHNHVNIANVTSSYL